MQENKLVSIRTIRVDMVSVIKKNSKENLSAFLRRIEIPVDNRMEKDAMALSLKDAVTEQPEYVIMVHSQEALMLLIDLWESEEIMLSQADWPLIGQLQLLGFVDYSISRDKKDGQDYIYLVEEAKDNFYFYLKSSHARKQMEKFDIWERLIRGIMTFYGIISFNRLYLYFCRCLMEPADDGELHRFLGTRVSLWSFGSMVMEKNSGVEYYENFEVKEPERILDLCEADQGRDYKKLDYEELLYIADNNGFGQWDGVGELADIFMENMGVEYYQTVVILKSCILMVQNGEGIRKILDNILKWCPNGRRYFDDLAKGTELLYYSVPIYSLKGWSRNETVQMPPRQRQFTVLKGGKDKGSRFGAFKKKKGKGEK